MKVTQLINELHKALELYGDQEVQLQVSMDAATFPERLFHVFPLPHKVLLMDKEVYTAKKYDPLNLYNPGGPL